VLIELNKSGFIQMKNYEDLIPETFKMDHILPYFIHIYPKNKSEFLKTTSLFQKYLLILQVLNFYYCFNLKKIVYYMDIFKFLKTFISFFDKWESEKTVYSYSNSVVPNRFPKSLRIPRSMFKRLRFHIHG